MVGGVGCSVKREREEERRGRDRGNFEGEREVGRGSSLQCW